MTSNLAALLLSVQSAQDGMRANSSSPIISSARHDKTRAGYEY